MKLKIVLVAFMSSISFGLSTVASAQFYDDQSILTGPDTIGELVSTIRYPAVSKTGNYILAWPENAVVYLDLANDNIDTGTGLQELLSDGTWGMPTSGIRKGSSLIVTDKAPGSYQYRLVRTYQEENCDQDGDGCTDHYEHYFEPAIEVVVVDGSQ